MNMSSLSKIGLGLSVVFTCLLLALVGEVYYLLWWKRRIIRRKIQDDFKPPRRDFFNNFCCKNPVISSVISAANIQNATQNQEASSTSTDQEFQFMTHNNKDCYGPTELVIGQPRFLFTIKEETKEDLESEDGRSTTIREGKRSLSDLLMTVESNATPPYLTPFSSPQFVTPPITPVGSCHSSQSGGYNPFYEASSDAEFSKIVRTSPPPKFKFLRDAEEKLQRRILFFEQAKKDANNLHKEGNNNDASFITIIVANNNENDKPIHHHYHSPHCPSGDSSTSSSQVLSFASSPSHLPPSNRKFMNFLTL